MTPQDAISLLNKTADLCDQEGAPVCRGMGLREIAEVVHDLERKLFMRNEHYLAAHEQHCKHVHMLEKKIWNLEQEVQLAEEEAAGDDW